MNTGTIHHGETEIAEGSLVILRAGLASAAERREIEV